MPPGSGGAPVVTLLSASILLFLVMDPFGNIPFFQVVLRPVAPARRRRVIAREMLIALAVLTLFLFAGPAFLALLHISEMSLQIAGGIILFLIAIRMIFKSPREMFSDDLEGEPLVVPLAIPSVAGPSAVAVVLVLSAQEPARWAEWLAALLLAWGATGLILLAASDLGRILGERGLMALQRLMGLLLTTIAVEMFIRGLRNF